MRLPCDPVAISLKKTLINADSTFNRGTLVKLGRYACKDSTTAMKQCDKTTKSRYAEIASQDVDESR
jgi:hypothetical protein